MNPMKYSSNGDSERRTKTNPDQASLISYTSTKTASSSGRKSQVKVACKVLCEMREDESSKLAMKFTQLRIVLGSQSLIQVISKYKSTKLQTYFWIFQSSLKQSQTIFSILPKTLLKNDVLNHKNILQENLLKTKCQNMNNILLQMIQRSQKQFFKKISYTGLVLNGMILIQKLMKQKQYNYFYILIINIFKQRQQILSPTIYKTSILEQENLQVLQDQQSYEEQESAMTMKEQLAIKFASTTLLVSLLTEKLLKLQLQFFIKMLKLKRNTFDTQNNTQLIQSDFCEINSKTQQVNIFTSIIQERFKEYFDILRQYNQQKIIEKINLSDSLDPPLETYRNQSNFNSENEIQIQQQDIKSLRQTHLDISIEQDKEIKQENKQIKQIQYFTQQSTIFTNQKRQNKLKNAIQNYYNEQQQILITPRTQQINKNCITQINKNKPQQKKWKYIKYNIVVIVIGMILFFILK